MLVFTACSQQETAPPVAKQSPEEQLKARRLYAELCANCHGAQARGGVGPDLTVIRFKYGKNRTEIIKSIVDGRSGGMPAFGSHLKPEEAAVLADFLLL